MRKGRQYQLSKEYKIMVIDDEEGIIDSVQALLNRNGYWCKGFTDPLAGLEELEREPYDLLVLDYYMQPIHGDKVVERIRRTDYQLYILLLTGHKDIAPPISTIKSLDIQAYCEKSDRLDQLQLLIESGIKSIAQRRAIQSVEQGMGKMLAAVPHIYQPQPMDQLLAHILRELPGMTGVSDAFLLVDELPKIDSGEAARPLFCGLGQYDVPQDQLPATLGPALWTRISRCRLEKQAGRGGSDLLLPLLGSQGRVMGVLYAASVRQDRHKLLELYAQQAAAAIANAFLHEMLTHKNRELARSNDELRHRYADTIEALRLAVDARDRYTRGHSDRVSQVAADIARALAMDAAQVERLRIAGIFHDIGKIGTADDILLNDRTLNELEYQEIQKHPVKGAEILSAVSMFAELAPIVRHHHERFDGQGYPDGLAGEAIELEARILAVADAFDAMVSDRKYRRHMPLEEAVKQLTQGAGAQFDPAIVQVFIQNVLTAESFAKQLETLYDIGRKKENFDESIT